MNKIVNTTENKVLSLLNKLSQSSDDFISVEYDKILVTDLTAEHFFQLHETQKLSDEILRKIVFVADHEVPSASEKASIEHIKMRDFAAEFGLPFHYGDGVGYQILSDNYVSPGDIVISGGTHSSFVGAVGALGFDVDLSDSANNITDGYVQIKKPQIIRVELTGKLSSSVSAKDAALMLYGSKDSNNFHNKIILFTGAVVSELNIDDMYVISHLSSSAGAVSSLFVSDDSVGNYKIDKLFCLDDVSQSAGVLDEVTGMLLLEQIPEGTPVNQVFIGGCASGRIKDLRSAAMILKNRKVASGVRAVMSPASRQDYIQALDEGIIEIFLESRFMVNNPGCGACSARAYGAIGEGEVFLSAGSRYIKGCAGDPLGTVILASVSVAAESSIAGKIFQAE